MTYPVGRLAGQVVAALERLADDRVVRLLGDLARPAGVERRQVPADHLDDALARRREVHDATTHTTVTHAQKQERNLL